MTHLLEEDLIAYQLGEPTEARGVAEHLERCSSCAALSESIAETLRVFSAEPMPKANLDHAWQRLRGNLPAPPVSSSRGPHAGRLWRWLAAPAALVAMLLVGWLALRAPAGRRGEATAATLRPGPLSLHPRDPAMASHLESAERLLTEVNHASGALDPATRLQAHDLLISNALYVQKAHAAGDVAEASLLEDLGRTLTTLDHEPQSTPAGWHLRLENTNGLLLDLRILAQNDDARGEHDAAINERDAATNDRTKE